VVARAQPQGPPLQRDFFTPSKPWEEWPPPLLFPLPRLAGGQGERGSHRTHGLRRGPNSAAPDGASGSLSRYGASADSWWQ